MILDLILFKMLLTGEPVQLGHKLGAKLDADWSTGEGVGSSSGSIDPWSSL